MVTHKVKREWSQFTQQIKRSLEIHFKTLHRLYIVKRPYSSHVKRTSLRRTSTLEHLKLNPRAYYESNKLPKWGVYMDRSSWCAWFQYFEKAFFIEAEGAVIAWKRTHYLKIWKPLTKDEKNNNNNPRARSWIEKTWLLLLANAAIGARRPGDEHSKVQGHETCSMPHHPGISKKNQLKPFFKKRRIMRLRLNYKVNEINRKPVKLKKRLLSAKKQSPRINSPSPWQYGKTTSQSHIHWTIDPDRKVTL